MKFNELALMQQVAILIELAGLRSPRSHETLEIKNEALSKHGLLQAPSRVKSTIYEYYNVTMDEPDQSPYATVSFEPQSGEEKTDLINLKISQRWRPELSDEVNLTPSGINLNFQLSEDLNKAFNKVHSILKGMESLLNTNDKISKSVRQLLTAYTQALELPDDVVDMFYVNLSTTRTLKIIARVMKQNTTYDFNRRIPRASSNHPLANETPEFGIIPGLTKAVNIGNRDKTFNLMLSLGSEQLDEITLSYRYNNQSFIELGVYPNPHESDHSKLLAALSKWITSTVTQAKINDTVVNMGIYLSESLSNTAPFIIKEIEKEGNNADYLNEPWF